MKRKQKEKNISIQQSDGNCLFQSVRYPAKTWIVDVMHEPGRLLLANSSDARNYTTLS